MLGLSEGESHILGLSDERETHALGLLGRAVSSLYLRRVSKVIS